MPPQEIVKAMIRPGKDSGYVAECLDIPVATKGDTLRSVTRNLQKAVAHHLEEEYHHNLHYAKYPSLVITMEIGNGRKKTMT